MQFNRIRVVGITSVSKHKANGRNDFQVRPIKRS